LHDSNLPTELPNVRNQILMEKVQRCLLLLIQLTQSWWIICQKTLEISLAGNAMGRRM